MAPLVKERLPVEYALGHRGWTVMPEFNSVWWWTLVSSLMLGVGIGALAQPQLAVRFMTVKSDRELNRAVRVGSFFILCTSGAAYMIGALSNVFFFATDKGFAENSSLLAIEAAGGNPDLIIPIFIREALPPLVLYIFALTMLSAAMSTLSSLFHVSGSSIGHDICIGLDALLKPTDEYQNNPDGMADFRSLITPKTSWEEDKEFRPMEYYQVFKEKHGFIPNLSIADLLFNMGPESIIILNGNK